MNTHYQAATALILLSINLPALSNEGDTENTPQIQSCEASYFVETKTLITPCIDITNQTGNANIDSISAKLVLINEEDTSYFSISDIEAAAWTSTEVSACRGTYNIDTQEVYIPCIKTVDSLNLSASTRYTLRSQLIGNNQIESNNFQPITTVYSEENNELIAHVSNVGTYADQHRWEDLQALFADQVLLDYSSFTGQAAQQLTPKEITDQWSPSFLGFDLTQHKMRNFSVEKNSNGSWHITADVRAIHFINNAPNGSSWIVDGSYDFTVNEAKKITMMRFNFDKTIGNNELPTIALNRSQYNTLSNLQQTDLAQINTAATWVKPINPAPSELAGNPNIKVVQDFFAAYAENDLDGIRSVMDENVQWYIPGKHKLAGTKKGVEEIVAYFSVLQKAQFKAEPMIIAANDDYVVDVHRGWSNTGNQDVDMNWVLLYQIEDGKIKQVQNFSADAYLADEFFERVFSYEDATEVLNTLDN